MFQTRMSIAVANAMWIADQMAFEDSELLKAALPDFLQTSTPTETEPACKSVDFSPTIEISSTSDEAKPMWVTIPESDWSEFFHPGRESYPRGSAILMTPDHKLSLEQDRPDLFPCFRAGQPNIELFNEWCSFKDVELMDVSHTKLPNILPYQSRKFSAKPPPAPRKPTKRRSSRYRNETDELFVSTRSDKRPSITMHHEHSVPSWWPVDTL